MKLLKIKAQGFKSFADKIEINVEDGITGIVGPNGSGKSNIVDAIRWVLGEQSVKALRGTQAMSDVIFSGSKTREAHNRCYVSLIFDNSDHYLKSEFKEIEIKRVLYRTGENDYFINNTKVRLKDIIDLFLDSGASKESFNIISQGNVKDVVNFKPEDRRIIIESAAGVLTYKKRKEETNRKIEKTNDNIEKVDLLINELKNTLDPLEIQAEKAMEYNKYYDELKNKEISLLTYEIETLNKTYVENINKAEDIKNKIVKYQASSGKTSVKLENLKLKQIKLDEDIAKLNENIISLNEKLSDLKSEKQITIERQKYDVDNSKLESNIINLKENKLKMKNMISQVKSAIESFKEKLKTIIENKDNHLSDEKKSRIKIAELERRLNLLNRDISFANNKIEIMQNNIDNNSHAPVAVREVLKNPTLNGIHATVGSLIESDKLYSTAINIALSSSSNFIVVDDEKCASKAIDYLKRINAGRATFFPLNIIKKRYLDDNIYSKIKNLNGFIDVAANLVNYNSKYENVIFNQLGNIIVCDTLTNAQIISKAIDYKARVVTLDGEIIHQGGSLTGGSLKNSKSIIQEKQLLEEEKEKLDLLNKEKSEIEESLKDENYNLEILKNIINTDDIEIVKLNSEINQNENFLKEYTEKQEEIEKELSGTKSIKGNDKNTYLDNIMKQYYDVENEIKIKSVKLNELKDTKNNIVLEISEIEKNINKDNSDYFHLQQDLKKYEIESSKSEVKLDNYLNTLSEEYSLTFEKAKTEYKLEDNPENVKNRVNILKSKIKNLGEVNIASIAERDRIKERYTFLTNQKDDLVNAISNLESIIEEMDEIMKEKITNTFEDVRKEFKEIFKGIFRGGTGDLILTNPDDILNTGIDIVAEPPGKKVASIGLLSGGEKTLTAIALLFAIINVKTVPFCILDEVEESLDEANVDIFGKYLQSKKNQSQFIIITHKKRTMEYADTLYGITMQESGVSKLVSVKLDNIN